MHCQRLGEILIDRGLLTHDQVEVILEEQHVNPQPFGLLAEDMFGVLPEDVEAAWAEQFAALTDSVDTRTERPSEDALRHISRRQAWQFRVFPLRFHNGSLILATTKRALPRAMRFASRCISVPCDMVITEPHMLGESLVAHYPIGGMEADMVNESVGLTQAGSYNNGSLAA